MNLIRQFKWDIFEHSPFRADLAPSDFHLFPKLRDVFGGSHFGSDDKLKGNVGEWLYKLAVSEYADGLEKMMKQYVKCQVCLTHFFYYHKKF